MLSYKPSLKLAVERAHGGKARCSEIVTVENVPPLWSPRPLQVVVFDMSGATRSTIAYAWSCWSAWAPQRGTYTALHLGDIRCAEDAVRLTLANDHRIQVRASRPIELKRIRRLTWR